jgi:hypothetical protein
MWAAVNRGGNCIYINERGRLWLQPPSGDPSWLAVMASCLVVEDEGSVPKHAAPKRQIDASSSDNRYCDAGYDDMYGTDFFEIRFGHYAPTRSPMVR